MKFLVPTVIALCGLLSACSLLGTPNNSQPVTATVTAPDPQQGTEHEQTTPTDNQSSDDGTTEAVFKINGVPIVLPMSPEDFEQATGLKYRYDTGYGDSRTAILYSSQPLADDGFYCDSDGCTVLQAREDASGKVAGVMVITVDSEAGLGDPPEFELVKGNIAINSSMDQVKAAFGAPDDKWSEDQAIGGTVTEYAYGANFNKYQFLSLTASDDEYASYFTSSAPIIDISFDDDNVSLITVLFPPPCGGKC